MEVEGRCRPNEIGVFCRPPRSNSPVGWRPPARAPLLDGGPARRRSRPGGRPALEALPADPVDFFGFFTVSSTKTKCPVARGLRPSAIRRRSRKGHPSQPRRPSGWLGAHAWTPPSRPPIQERGPRRRPPQNLEIERANDRNTPIFIGLQLLQEPLMRVLKSTKSPKKEPILCTRVLRTPHKELSVPYLPHTSVIPNPMYQFSHGLRAGGMSHRNIGAGLESL